MSRVDVQRSCAQHGRLRGCGFPTELGAKGKTTKKLISSGAFGGFSRKFAPVKISRYTVWGGGT